MTRTLLVAVLVLAVCAVAYGAASHKKIRDEDNVCGPWWGSEDSCKWHFEEASHILTIQGDEMGDFYYCCVPWGHLAEEIHIVVIEEGITNIGNNAFYGCNNMYSISIPSTVTRIGEHAFDGCSSLSSVVIPSNVNRIDTSPFLGCSNLSSLYVEEGNTNYMSYDDVLYKRESDEFHLIFCPVGKNGTVVVYDNTTAISYYAFKGCNQITSVLFPPTVTAINEGAFLGCSNLTSIVIPDGVTSIDYSTFESCTNLVSVVLPDSVTSISSKAFYECTHLTYLTIPAYLDFLGDAAFYNCNITSLSIPSTTTYIGPSAIAGCDNLFSIEVDENNTYYKSMDGVLFNFEATRLIRYPVGKVGSYDIPETVTTIDSGAFRNCISLKSVTIPSGVSSIEVGTFSFSINLESVVIPESVTSIGMFAFEGCSSLENVTIPSGVTIINEYTFKGCSSLLSVIIPSGLTHIRTNAFRGCSSLTSVTIPSTVTDIDYEAFCECGKLSWMEVEDGPNPTYTSENGVLFNKDKTELVKYPSGKPGSYSIPDTVNTLKFKAFYGATGLTSVIVPNSITIIDEIVFEGCTSLSSVTLPPTLTAIKRRAFAGCDSLTSIIIPAEVSSIDVTAFSETTNLVEIDVDKNNENYKSDDGVLYDKDGLHLLLYPRGKVGSFVIPDGVVSIDKSAFEQSKGLESITIPSSVTSIEEDAFNRCDSLTSIINASGVKTIGVSAFSQCSSLTSLTIPQGVTSIGRYAFCGCNSIVHLNIPPSVVSIEESAFSGCSRLVSVIFEGTEDPGNWSVISEQPFRYCSALEFICVPPNYQSSIFCGRSTICRSGKCEELRTHINQCYRVLTDETVEKRPNATRWERQTNQCFEYHCYNDTGRHSWSLCNNTDDSNFVCADTSDNVEEQCAAGDEEALGLKGWPVDIAISATHVNNFNMTHIVGIFSNVTKSGNIQISTGANKQGKLVRIVAIVEKKESAIILQQAATKCKDMEQDEEASEMDEEGECGGVLARITSAKLLTRTIVVPPTVPTNSNDESTHDNNITKSLFVAGGSDVHSGKSFVMISFMLLLTLFACFIDIQKDR